VVAVAAGTAPSGAQQEQDAPWPMVGRDAARSGTLPGGSAPPYRIAWTAEVPGGPRGGPVVAGGLVIVVGAAGVVALDSGTGETRWEVPRSEGPAGPPAVVGDVVVHTSGRGRRGSIVARALSTGREEWRSFVQAAPVGGIAADEDRVYVGLRSGSVVALETDEGEEAWRFRVKGRLETTPAAADDTVVVVSEDFRAGTATVYGLDAATGSRSWAFSPPGLSVGASSPAIGGATVFVGMGDGQVHALDLESGRERWAVRVLRTGFADPSFAPAAIPAAGEALIVTDIATVYRIDPGTGSGAWSFRDRRWELRPEDLLLAGAPIVVGQAVLIGNGGGVVTAIDLGSGDGVWRQDVGEGPLGPMAADGDRLYAAVQGKRGRVVALEHDPQGSLVPEESATVLSPLRAAVNVAAAMALVGVAVLALFRYGAAWIGRLRGPAPPEDG
jgi:outer membrane protein assembly factor BamB